MPINGIPAEFIQLAYKDGDKLYLPIYRIGQIQKYSGPAGAGLIDKLGGLQWQKTKAKVRNQLRELAADLLALYAKRAQATRAPFPPEDDDFAKFEGAFPYDETEDQLKAIADILRDLGSDRPMDRLVCGDVGFGKTEIAMRAAFKAIQARRQVAVLAPTTVLTFQHFETFSRRFRQWPVTIKALNRFVPNNEARQAIEAAKEGKVDILIGTHRLLSKDVAFKDLGLMIVDEEQKFGVTHKEKIKRFRANVDCLTLSATPIPRTLNMSLVGMRDLSIINTPPVDRLPTRTFVCKYDAETIRKAILAEIARGGQVFFLHNRVQSIYSTADELRQVVPEARMRVGHGQMDEHELEKTMVAFFSHEIDVLVCTTIIESGIDNPRANTMFIDNAQQFGLSQLYQLRGRVGRSKERAYCYLLIPGNRRLEADAQERLKVIQENTALGSGFRIAHHDLELRGAGNLLGEDQSGQIDAVGYEMYLELLENAMREAKGEEVEDAIEPDINVRIAALIPDTYIGDIRIRLSYYKALSEIGEAEDLDRIEEELRDQFGPPPPPVINLMGLMLIRRHCRELGVRDLSSAQKSISLAFTDKTPIKPERIVRLAQLQPKKFSLTPDSRLVVRMPEIAWPLINEELLELRKLL
jgi:transcription-repair coupling factor (superfamily II helicase)